MIIYVGISYNRPKFCPNATWNATAVTFAPTAVVGTNPAALFVDSNNTVYIANTQYSWVSVWPEGSTASIRNISSGLQNPYGMFVTSNGDMYIDNGDTNKRVDKWSVNATNSTPVMFQCGRCADIYITTDNRLYCAMRFSHQVVAKSISDNLNVWTRMAGTGVAGSTSTTLNNPTEIYVMENRDLYVADYQNSRIQKFPYGQLAATTVDTTPFTLNQPEGLTFDADGYIFISDCANCRLLGSSQYGFRCIVGCSGCGSSATQLYNLADIRFDSYGNLYVNDFLNSRIQKFTLLQNTCGK